MYRIVLISAFSLLLVSGVAKQLKVVGEGITGEEKVFLYEYLNDELFVIDSTEVAKGKFLFKLEKEVLKPGMYALAKKKGEKLSIVLRSKDVLIIEKKGKLSVGESPDSEELQKFLDHLASYDATLKTIDKKYNSIAPMRQSDPHTFQQKFEVIRKSLDSLNSSRLNFFKTMHSDSPSEYMKKVSSIYVMNESTTKLNYFKATDFSDEEFTRGVLLEKKINMYFMSYVSLSAQNIQTEFNQVLAYAPQGSRSRQVVYATLIKIAPVLDQDFARKLYKDFVKEYPTSAFAKRQNKYVPKGPPKLGDEAPEISLKDPEGKVIKLSSLRGNVVLIDFWASWCGPCRREMPNVVRAYQQYKDKGFTVYSISFDGDKKRWLKAIEDDGMVWPNHVSELKKWDSTPGRDYFVRGIPATFLIDREGVIVGTNLRGAQLDKKLAQLLDK